MKDVLILMVTLIFMIGIYVLMGKLDDFEEEIHSKMTRVAIEQPVLLTMIPILKEDHHHEIIVLNNEKTLFSSLIRKDIDFALFTTQLEISHPKIRFNKMKVPLEDTPIYNEIYIYYHIDNQSDLLKRLLEL